MKVGFVHDKKLSKLMRARTYAFLALSHPQTQNT